MADPKVESISGIPSESRAGSSNKPAKMLGRFRLISLLGEGAMGKVVRAEDTTLKRQVALKVLPNPKDKQYKVEQFAREARSAANLEHPNIVHIYEVGQAAGHHYIAMELIEGGNLAAMVRASGPLDLLRACTVGAEAAEALAYAAQMGVVHRDVKPENLMLTRGGRCKLTDFGLARIDDPSDGFNLPSEAVGTPNYIAPELLRGQAATAKSDVYSLGAVLFFLFTGKVPFPGKSRDETLKMHVNAPPPDLRAARPDLPEGLAKVVWQTLAKDPAHRPDANTLAKTLRSYTIGASQTNMSMSMTGMPLIKPASDKKWLMIAGIVGGSIVVVGIVIVVVIMMNMNRTSPVSYVPPPAPAVTPEVPVTPPHVVQTPVIAVTPTTPTTPVATGTPTPTPMGPTTPTTPATPAPVDPSKPPAVATPTGPTKPVVALTPVALPPNVPAGTIAVTDTAALEKLADADKPVTIFGTVASIKKSASNKVAQLKFKENHAFTCAIFPDQFTPFQTAFGGDVGRDLAGKPVLVTGTITTYKDSLEMANLTPQSVKIVTP